MENDKILALVDCNSFYCSCERVFNPRLEGKPVVVLSNNDGCAISRTDEAKALGIEMGVPFFKIKDLIRRHKIHVFSSNYTLYGDMSRRIMNLLKDFTPDLEVYSIDEAFLDLSGFKTRNIEKYAQLIRSTILTQTGIPVSIGLGSTKVLAKMANRLAKRKSAQTEGVFSLLDKKTQDHELAHFEVRDVWGIGRQSARKLNHLGIFSAKQLRDCDERLIQKQLTVVGARLVQELRGISCLTLEQMPKERKTICSSRSFGRPVFKLDELKEAIAHHVHSTAEKLRKDRSLAQALIVFIQTNPHKSVPQYYNSTLVELPVGSSSTPKLIRHAFCALASIFREGYEYKKCGVILNDLQPKANSQLDLFSSGDTLQDEILMQTMDAINRREGSGTIKPAACGVDPFWRGRRELRSQAYTTRWSELLTVR